MSNEIIKWSSGETNFIYDQISGNPDLLPDNSVIIIDHNVSTFYPHLTRGRNVIIVNASEESKSFEFIQRIYKKFLEMGVDKSTVIVGIGGGITCDIAGFGSSTFYRGTRLILVPTTLLAMADAAIGGKNGVNFEGHKNIIGTIRQPEKIVFDSNFLKTLPENETRNGMAEVIKHAIISGEDLFNEILAKNISEDILKGDFPDDLLKKIIQVKIDIVRVDEFEKNRRKTLNFGHTLGHIIELKQKIKHGEAVSIGMMMAFKLSLYFEKCDIQTIEKLKSVLQLYNLPHKTSLSIGELVCALEFDKKKRENKIHFVFADKIGKVYDEAITIEKLTRSLTEVFG